MNTLIKHAAICCAAAVISTTGLYGIDVSQLRCNYRENPLGVETENPQLGWILTSETPGDRQTAYEIRVAGSPASLESGSPDLWGTGKVASGQSQHIRYAGKSLTAGKKYYWQVKVWDMNGEASEWSEVNSWITAPSPEDLDAQWVGAILHEDSNLPPGRDYHGLSTPNNELWNKVAPLAKRSIMLRKEFTLDGRAENALVYISGLGQYELFVNGQRVNCDVFKPLWSDYDKTVYYNVYDIAPLLREGRNVFGVMLGNGMYNVAGGRYAKFRGSFGPPTLFLQSDITIAGGETGKVVSDGSWKYDLSPIIFNDIFGGEDYDANLEQPGWNAAGFDDSAWKPVVVQQAPKGKLTAQYAPPVVVAETFKVKTYEETSPGHYFFDMGQNLAGFPTIKVKGQKGQKIRLILGEITTDEKNKVRQENSGSPYWLEYTFKGEGVEEWTPMFTYYGYQYIEIDGIDYLKPERKSDRPVLLDLTSRFIYSGAQNDGRFESSNEIFNRTHFIIDRAVRSNMQSVMTDCPHREKLGWLEETHLNGPGLLFNYDMRIFYRKVMQDIRDAQLPDGLIPDIAPEYVIFDDGFRDSPEWGSAGVVIPWLYYEWYGDDTLIREYYPVMRRYVDYLSSKADGYILSYGLGDWCDFSDQLGAVSVNTPLEITATGHYYFATELLAKAAGMFGNVYDETTYGKLAADIANAYNTRLFDPSTCVYGSGSQCSYALPIFLGIVPDQYKERVMNNFLQSIADKGGKLTTGNPGNRYLYQSLARNGHNDVMYRMHNHYDVPGYGYQIALGVTTLTEQWDPLRGNSWNHFMMGQIEEWFYESLAGIKPDMDDPGFKHFFIEPVVVGDMTFVNALYNSMYGMIRSEWKIENGRFRLAVEVPVNTTATITIPFGNEKIELGSGKHELSCKVK